ncbi:glycosyltransferase family 2 protein [Salinimicrobium gaetbulicola]|uniref:Glycosyltransferase family 2 protein n=1 Tax=Salinimicrobium gaetbulicola TaxID=999702 RepID=A0ABW3IKA3_9FLAO
MDLETADLSKTPKVSVIVPTFNRKDLLKEALDSIRAQTLKDWECIIVDDGSTDGTIPFLQDWVIKDQRFKYFSRPDYYLKGAASCRNYGLIQSKGRYIQWLDDDDLISKNKLEFQIRKLEEYSEEDCFATCSWDLYWTGKQIELKYLISEEEYLNSKSFFKKLFEKQSFIPASAYLIPRSITFSAGMWNQSLSLNDDAEYFTRILLHSKKLVMTGGCYVLYREHSNERISTRTDKKSLDSFLLSLHLIYSHLLSHHIKVPYYFKWKLKKVFLQYSHNSMDVLQMHYYFFRENGIDLRFPRLLNLRILFFKKIYPLYKKLIQRKVW